MINEKNTKTSLPYWFRETQRLDIPQPETEIVPCDRGNVLDWIEGGDLDADFVRLLESAAEKIGYPVFMRTDLCSAKHDWKNSCYVKDKNSLWMNFSRLIQYNEMADLMGLPYTSIVIREFLPLEATFIAFHGDMPINKERRYFIENGEVLCHHPYWPVEAIEEHTKDPEWATKLAALNEEEIIERALLGSFAREVSRVLPGFWSVDFAKSTNGKWYLIDMAVGEASYHWPECQNAGRQNHL